MKKALEANFVDTELFNNTYTPIVVNTGKNLVVIDTGLGEAGIESSKGTAGNFLTNLAAAGIDPKCRHRDHLAFPRRPRERPSA